MRWTVLALVLVTDAVFTLLMLYSLLRPEHRIWPLDRSEGVSLRGLVNWTLSGIMLLGVPALAWMDAGSLGLPSMVSLLGGLMIVLGIAITAAGVLNLGVKTSAGYTGTLRTTGIYRYTRNPQVIGDIIALCGVALLADSVLALVAALAGTVVHLLYPFAEEPWLREAYEGYREYREEVPRFVDARTVRRLWNARSS